ncbi:MAG: Holliday junction resolvase RuvX [Acholeplasmatales bacterium]|jgi:putative Holliday junction resolvase|nr:Holliday junction resolvase RuvX [Acholeplasmatales bacterium]
MTYFGLDLGTKSLGVAISYSGVLATNLLTIHFSGGDYLEAIKRLKPLILEYQPQILVLGEPKHMSGEESIGTSRSAEFKKLLEETFQLKVELEDERLSTVESLSYLQGLQPKKKKALVDNVAAMIILQKYLDKKSEENKNVSSNTINH